MSNHEAYRLHHGSVSVPDAGLFVVLPTIRPELLREFCYHWVKPDLNVRFIIVHDSPEPPSCSLGISQDIERLITHLYWFDIDAELGDKRWIIPRRSDCVRSYGFLRAKQMGAKYILSLDDDCLVKGNMIEHFFARHLEPLMLGVEPIFSTTGFHDRGQRPRGLPDGDACSTMGHPLRVGINHGLWDGVLDRSGLDEKWMNDQCGHSYDEALDGGFDVVPKGMFYPMCGMNVCFDVELLPAMYFTLQGHWFDLETNELTKLPYDRWGDIWCGAISKAVCDMIGISVTSGDPHVWHTRRSNVDVNIAKEADGLALHPHIVRSMVSLASGYGGPKLMHHSMMALKNELLDLADDDRLSSEQSDYILLLRSAIKEWESLTYTPQGYH